MSTLRSDVSDTTAIPRDRWLRPRIIPLGADGNPDLTAALVSYTRVSTLAEKLEDKTNIGKWRMRVAALGIARDRSIYQRIASLAGFEDPLNTRKNELQAVMDRAFEMGGGSSAAESGTAFHELSEIADNGGAIAMGSLPPELAQALTAYLTETKSLKVEASELFAVNDELRAAGTMDRLYRMPDGAVIVGDVKGLALDTPIATPTGWSTMADLRVGDEVFDSDGKPCTVTIKSEVKRIGTFIVKFDDGSEVTCDSEHLWWTMKRGYDVPQVRSVQEVADTLFYGKGKHRQHQHKVPVAPSLQLPSIDLPIPPYLLGCWLGDGHVRGGGITKESDLFSILEADGVELGVEQRGRNTTVTRQVLGLTAHLREHRLLYNKHIPSEYLRGSHEQRLLLLQGLMDTDGTWNTARRRACFNSTDKALAESVRELVLTLGEKAHISEANTRGFGKEVVSYAVEFTPRSFIPFRLPRKVAKVQMKGKKFDVAGRRMIMSIESGPDVETACIGVDSPNHTYLCGKDMIPTHNTGSDHKWPTKVHTQLATYSHSKIYNPVTGERFPLHEDLDPTRGLLVSVSLNDGTCTLYELDLTIGLTRARLAAAVRDLPSIAKLSPIRWNDAA